MWCAEDISVVDFGPVFTNRYFYGSYGALMGKTSMEQASGGPPVRAQGPMQSGRSVVLDPKNWGPLDELKKLSLAERDRLECLDYHTAFAPGSNFVGS